MASGREGRAKAERAWSRWRLRKAEYYAFAAKMKKKLKEGQLLIIEKLTGGPSGGVLRKGLEGLPYTGDHDVFAVHGNTKAVLNELKESPFRVQHGAHVDWPQLPEVLAKGGMSPAEQAIYDRIIASHAPGGKALLRINPKAPPTASASSTLPGLPAIIKGTGSFYDDLAAEDAAKVVEAKPIPLGSGFAGLVEAEKRLKEQGAAKT